MSAPSVALKNTGEYLQTPRYNEGIVKFSFMYRFASSGSAIATLLLRTEIG